ncbi:hypothetical protein EC973_000061 [Apophysomyces ossiformis]|uniref:MYND-type domain-containing protein n=1 Tax=Apophysomyces ossiformis TaxID=679940 RepID=A0A8H7ETH3_9FUNG|nr:hypothetical protein EC973_000061 [Apophysomyces ossiformis]
MPLIKPIVANTKCQKQLTPPSPTESIDRSQVYQDVLSSLVASNCWDAHTLDLTEQITQWLIERYPNHTPTLSEHLWQWSKQLKAYDHDEEDKHIRYEQQQLNGAEYRRAIRLTIYYCHARLSENDLDKVKYYRKCLEITTRLPTQQHLQKLATLALEEHQHQAVAMTNHSGYTTPKSRTSSISSGGESSTSLKSCANCGTEKRGMPVCARCKSQAYCTLSCLKADRTRHALTCSR